MPAIIIITLALLLLAPAAYAQNDAELAARQLKNARLLDVGDRPQPRVQNYVPPSIQTDTTPYFPFRLIMGALYEPTIFPDEQWIWIGCQAVDPRLTWSTTAHGLSALVWVHAIIYELTADGSLNFDTAISTAETTALDETVCDLKSGIDAAFIDIPRSFDPQVITLFSVPRASQRAEVVEVVGRQPTPHP